MIYHPHPSGKQNKGGTPAREPNSIISSLPGFVYQCKFDEHFTVLYISEKCHDITGYEPDDLIGNRVVSFNDIICPEYRQEIHDFWKKTLQRGSVFRHEYQIICANKSKRWVYERGHGVLNSQGELLYLEGYIEDISERKHHELLQDTLYRIASASMLINDLPLLISTIRDHLSAFIDARNFYIALYDEETGMLSLPYESDEIDNITEWPAEKSVTGLVIKEKKPLLLKRRDINKLFKSGAAKQLGYLPEVWLGVPLVHEDHVIGAIVVQDYHNPDAYDEDSRGFLEFVSNHICLAVQRNRTMKDLVGAKEKAEESDRLKSAFLANISHEIRTPMNGILGFLELLRQPNLEEDKKEKYIDVVNKSGQRLLDTINDIVEISKIEAGRADIYLGQTDLDALMQYQLSFFTPQAEEKSISLTLVDHLKGDDAIIHTDQFKVNGVLTNLLRNAIKFTPAHGRVEFGNFLRAGNLVFFVKDSGIGIPGDQVESVFQRFVQADMAFSRSYEGSGLGLSIAKAHVEAMGGKIWVESVVGQGSTFYFTLPLDTPPNGHK